MERSLLTGVRWAVRAKDARSVRIGDMGATEDAALAPFSAGRWHSDPSVRLS